MVVSNVSAVIYAGVTVCRQANGGPICGPLVLLLLEADNSAWLLPLAGLRAA